MALVAAAAPPDDNNLSKTFKLFSCDNNTQVVCSPKLGIEDGTITFAGTHSSWDSAPAGCVWLFYGMR